jgi:hypothetical protein
VLQYYPNKYNRQAAKNQCCYYLNDWPQTAAQVMQAMDADHIHFSDATGINHLPSTTNIRDFSRYIATGISIPHNSTNPPAVNLCIPNMMTAYGHDARWCAEDHSAHHSPAMLLHMENILQEYPDKYDKRAAKHQCCQYLHDRPQAAARLMNAIENDVTHFK